MKLTTHYTLKIGTKIGQCRAVPVRYRPDEPEGILALTCADFDVDPFVEMFFFPDDTLKMTMIAGDGRIIWQRDLGRGVVPGMWFCPAFPFDLDRDGVEDIWYVTNSDPSHPLALSKYRLERIDAATGEPTGQWPWPGHADQRLSYAFRNFVFGGYASGTPTLVTAQGTYGSMYLQGHRVGPSGDPEPAWETVVATDAPGARGSHMCPVVDINNDGDDEFFWGERCLRISDGSELFCADRDSYRGHSDIIAPVLDWRTGSWSFYTCRESDGTAAPRVAHYDAAGNRLWGVLDAGHIDMGWVASRDGTGSRLAMATRIGAKTCGPDGREHTNLEEFFYDLSTGAPRQTRLNAYKTLPVDLNGDGIHELVRGAPGGTGEVLDLEGNRLGSVGGAVAVATRVIDRPGEHLLSYHDDGTIALWYDADAVDCDHAKDRYAHPYYQSARKLTATGSNLVNLGGM
ncbi:MAG: hypothetical protein EA382_12140 [Spirochaetaceae bacterium]|nr:MAG: hypothetical protein EA382_12140 [Spirochaetaceae bacterium]